MSHVSFRTLLRAWPWALGGGVLGAVVAYALSQFVTPLYQSTAVLYYALSFGNTASDLSQGSTYTESQMLSFGELVTSQIVLDPVIQSESLPLTSHDLANQISVSTPRGTMIMEITASSASPELAARIANAVANEQRQTVESIAPRKESGDSTVTVRLIEEGVVPQYPYTPNTKLNMLLGALAGALLVGGGSILVRLMDKRLKSAEDLKRVTEMPFLGSIRDMEAGQSLGMVMLQDPTSLVSEDFRQLQANLRYATMSKQPVVLVVSSAVSGEGKSTISINLATVLAERGQKVLLIDADLRRPRVAQYAQVEGSVGLTDVLVGQQTLEEAAQPLGDSGVTVLTSGPIPPNPGELLGSVAMSDLLERAAEQYATVVVDTAPVLAVADAALMTHKADGLVLVTRARKTTTTSLEKCVAQLESAGVNVFGIVLNGARRGRDKNLKYYEYTPSRQPGTHHGKAATSSEGEGETVSDIAILPESPEPEPTEAEELVDNTAEATDATVGTAIPDAAETRVEATDEAATQDTDDEATIDRPDDEATIPDHVDEQPLLEEAAGEAEAASGDETVEDADEPVPPEEDFDLLTGLDMDPDGSAAVGSDDPDENATAQAEVQRARSTRRTQVLSKSREG